MIRLDDGYAPSRPAVKLYSTCSRQTPLPAGEISKMVPGLSVPPATDVPNRLPWLSKISPLGLAPSPAPGPRNVCKIFSVQLPDALRDSSYATPESAVPPTLVEPNNEPCGPMRSE